MQAVDEYKNYLDCWLVARDVINWLAKQNKGKIVLNEKIMLNTKKFHKYCKNLFLLCTSIEDIQKYFNKFLEIGWDDNDDLYIKLKQNTINKFCGFEYGYTLDMFTEWYLETYGVQLFFINDLGYETN